MINYIYLIYLYIHICNEVMNTIQFAHPLYNHNGFVTTCQSWTPIGGVQALLVFEAIECSTSTKQGT